jgi:ribose transport system permease protein
MKGIVRRAWFGPLVALACVYVLFALLAPDTFARAANLATMARQTVVVAIAAVGMTLVIVHGGIDLSVGSGVALATVVIASLLKSGHGPLAACLGGIACIGLAGLATGTIITRLRIAPFIVTLGSMSILRGAAKGLANEQKIDVDPHGLDSLLAPPDHGLFPTGVWVAIALAVLAAATLRSTRFGRHVFAVGSNEATARLCGIDVDRVRVAVYAIAGPWPEWPASWSSPRSRSAIPPTRSASSSRSSPRWSSAAHRSPVERGPSPAR